MWSVVSKSESYDMRNKSENIDFREDLSYHYSTASIFVRFSVNKAHNSVEIDSTHNTLEEFQLSTQP